MAIDRRSFLHRAAVMIPAMHALPGFAMPHDDPPIAAPPAARFARLKLRTAIELEKLATFYRDTLRLPIEFKDGVLCITAGDTTIDFTRVESREGRTDPYYHFAFNIPHNQLDKAKAWLESRCPLVKLGDGGVIANFENWNAHAFYFLDPAGNILEFIARHTLKNDAAGEFSEKGILCTSEIGVVAPDVIATADKLCEAVKLERYRGGGNEQFTAVGDEQGLFIVVNTGRRWFSSDRVAQVFEAEARVRDASQVRRSTQIESSKFAVDLAS